MYLKRLELHGFKTFAARTVLEFERGVTAVVGPNGSGKSNLADAVRWALGEQNPRNVRCRQADELIFAGSAGDGERSGARAPMSMAEVMVTFDNSAGWLPVDFEEVRIGRRLYRTGDNEYLMNGARVRLRDITDLLARACVSTSSHLVIGQGLVDTVLGLRAEERRTLVENLAGLRFYYSRREDAAARLRATETNLRHVDAMISEAAPHLETLRQQAGAYAEYHGVERELRDLLLLHYAHAYAVARDRESRQGDHLGAAQAALEEAAAAARQGERELAGAREQVRSLAEEAVRLRGDVRAAHAAREAAERGLAVGKARREAAAARVTELRSALPALRAQHEAALAELRSARQEAGALEDERARLHEARAPIEEAVTLATGELATAEHALRLLAERRRALETQAARTAADLAALEREETAAAEEHRRQATDEQAMAAGRRDATEAVTGARAARDRAMAAVEDARGAESRARLLAGVADERFREAAVERRALEQRVAELEGRRGGLRTWLQALGGQTNAADTVASMLVATPASAPALAAALGPVLYARLAPSALEVRAAGALLDAGARGVLLPGRSALSAATQDTLIETAVSGGVAREGIAGWGDALARSDAIDDSSALRNLLSTVLVVRDLETLWHVHTILPATGPAGAAVVLATPGGEALLPTGLLYRPAGDGTEALERTRELRRVEAEVALAAQALRAAVAVEEQTGRERLERAASAAQTLRALRDAEHERNARTSDLAAAERIEAQARREAQWIVERGRRAAEGRAGRAERRAALAAQARDGEMALAALQADERPATVRCDRARDGLQAATTRRAEHGAARALVSARTADAARRLGAAEEMATRLESELRGRASALAQSEDELGQLATDEDGATAAVFDAARRLRVLHRHLDPLEADLAALEARTADCERRLALLRGRESEAGVAREAAALARQRAEHERETVVAALQADLALAPVDLPPAAAPPAALPAGLQGRIKSLRARLGAFGPVNARAPDDLATAEERQTFLRDQSADLREGIARLRALIAEANATVRERFGTVTGELDAQFRLYLQHLFGGGRGALTALYDEAGLPSGLDIAAQPPGKRTSELSLLSGGERALVGLALVFAMLAVRPLPFCVLDEAEAALDEANTLRVGEILRDLSARTQMIVITHNRGTMSHADTLYGVTMSETGVSQVAGLRLEEIDAIRRSRAG